MVKKKLRKIKQEHFKTYCNELNPKNKIGVIYRSLKNFKKRSLGFYNEQKKIVNFENNPEINKVLEKICCHYTYNSDIRNYIIRENIRTNYEEFLLLPFPLRNYN